MLKASFAIILVLSACQGDVPQTPADGGMDHAGMDADTSAFGEPGDIDMADRTIQVSMFDTSRYEPAEVSVELNETIAFEVTNEGELPHEFVLGDRAFQEDHETEMAGMGDELPPDELFAITVQPGDTESLAWTFSEAGTFEYACHVAGHYDAGMVGTISVQG
jgi:uncharacterized cupredoxin-like copper-binding protein